MKTNKKNFQKKYHNELKVVSNRYPSQEKGDRLKEALRENLKKRKKQARNRKQSEQLNKN